MNPVEIALQPAESANTLEVNPVDALRALMEFYESGQVLAPGRTKVLDFGALAAHRPTPDTKNPGAPCR